MIGTLCRSILAEAHTTFSWEQDGPFYVVHDRGEFRMYPFGRGNPRQYFYLVDQVWMAPGPLPTWLFVVLGRWE